MQTLSEFSGIPLSQETGIGALTLPRFIHDLASRHAERCAICWRDLSGEDQRWSYQELLQKAEQVAQSLTALGVSKGSRVGILVSNRPEWLFCLFGASMTGAVTVALNTFSTRQELIHQLKFADLSVVLLEAEVASKNFVEDFLAICPALQAQQSEAFAIDEFPFLRHVACIDRGKARGGILDWEKFLARGAAIPVSLVRASAAAADPVDDGLIFFSSGSTALPKAIRHTHRAATLQCWRLAKIYDYDESVRTWNANGYFFSGNFAMAFATLCRGGCLVMLRYFDPEQALELIQREKVSCIIAWPHQEARLKDCPQWETGDFSTAHWVVPDSVFLSHPTVSTDWGGFNGYGSTETFTFVTLARVDGPISDAMGPPLPGNTIRIVDPDTGATLPLGQTGEIVVKGPTLTPGYLKIAPEEAFDSEGFLHTADAGYLSEEGILHWEGRLSDIIKTGGANVSPAEIDAVIAGHPAIRSSHTIGIPHQTLGEIVVSCIVLREGQQLTASDVKDYAKQTLSGYKVPREVLFLNQGELPMTGTNKVKLAGLRDIAARRLSGD